MSSLNFPNTACKVRVCRERWGAPMCWLAAGMRDAAGRGALQAHATCASTCNMCNMRKHMQAHAARPWLSQTSSRLISSFSRVLLCPLTDISVYPETSGMEPSSQWKNTAQYLYFPWLACNKTEIATLPTNTVLQSVQSSDDGQNGQNFSLALNIGSAFSDSFQVLTAIQAPNSLGSLGCRKPK